MGTTSILGYNGRREPIDSGTNARTNRKNAHAKRGRYFAQRAAPFL